MPPLTPRAPGAEDSTSALVVKIDQVLAYRDRIHHARCRAAASQILNALKRIGVSARPFGKLTEPARTFAYPSPIELCIVSPAQADAELQRVIGQTLDNTAGSLEIRIHWLQELPPKMRQHVLESSPIDTHGVDDTTHPFSAASQPGGKAAPSVAELQQY